jgi:hypothetical protein
LKKIHEAGAGFNSYFSLEWDVIPVLVFKKNLGMVSVLVPFSFQNLAKVCGFRVDS